MRKTNSQEIVMLSGAINTILDAVEESKLGKVMTKLDESDLSNDPRKIITNNVALGAFNIILSEHIKSMYKNN